MSDEHTSPVTPTEVPVPARVPRQAAAPAKAVRHADPITLAIALREHLGKQDGVMRKGTIDRTRTTLLDAATLRLVLAVTKIPGIVDEADFNAALALALHGL